MNALICCYLFPLNGEHHALSWNKRAIDQHPSEYLERVSKEHERFDHHIVAVTNEAQQITAKIISWEIDLERSMRVSSEYRVSLSLKLFMLPSLIRHGIFSPKKLFEQKQLNCTADRQAMERLSKAVPIFTNLYQELRTSMPSHSQTIDGIVQHLENIKYSAAACSQSFESRRQSYSRMYEQLYGKE